MVKSGQEFANEIWADINRGGPLGNRCPFSSGCDRTQLDRADKDKPIESAGAKLISRKQCLQISKETMHFDSVDCLT